MGSRAVDYGSYAQLGRPIPRSGLKPASAESTRRSMKGLKPFPSLLLGCLVCAILSGCAGSVPQNGPGALDHRAVCLIPRCSRSGLQTVVDRQRRQTALHVDGQRGQSAARVDLNHRAALSAARPRLLEPSTSPSKSSTRRHQNAAIDTSPLSITINPPLSLVTTSLPSGIVGSNYTATITASNGVQPYTYAVGVWQFAALCTGSTMQPEPWAALTS